MLMLYRYCLVQSFILVLMLRYASLFMIDLSFGDVACLHPVGQISTLVNFASALEMDCPLTVEYTSHGRPHDLLNLST